MAIIRRILVFVQERDAGLTRANSAPVLKVAESLQAVANGDELIKPRVLHPR
jgi:hypothetical protein